MSPAAPAVSRRRGSLSDDQLTLVLERLPTAVIAVDREATLRYANLAAQRLFHVLGIRFRAGEQVGDLGSGSSLRAVIDSAFARGYVTKSEVELGDGRTLSLSGAAIAERSLTVIEIADVSAQRRKARAGEDLIVNAAHEFLTPLTSISAAAHVLQNGGNEVEDIRDRFLDHIAAAVDRLISISRAVLVLARAEAEVEPLRPERVPIGPLLREVLATTGAGQPNAVRGVTDAVAFVDRDLLVLALSTLVENARQHAAGDKLYVQVEGDEQGIVAVTIVDEGRGIAPERLDGITRRFSPAESRDSHGFGIGLSIAARAARVLGGKLLLDSDGTGTRARIEVSAYGER
jgi:signal transduction histidine kinase